MIQAGQRKKKRGYDVRMIRDFIEHLKCEVRIRCFQNTAKRGTVNPELAEQIRPYAEKYDCGLLIPTIMNTEGATQGEVEEAARVLNEANRKVCDKWIESLEGLEELFSQALHAATFKLSEAPAGQTVAMRVNVRDLLSSDEIEDANDG